MYAHKSDNCITNLCVSFHLDAHSKGLFFGASMEASIIATRPDINSAFYGMEVKPSLLLSGGFPRPKAAEPLYKALSEVLSDVETNGYRSSARQFTSVTSVFEPSDGKLPSSSSPSSGNVVYYTDMPSQSHSEVLQHGRGQGQDALADEFGDNNEDTELTTMNASTMSDSFSGSNSRSRGNGKDANTKSRSLSTTNIWAGIGEGNFGLGEDADIDVDEMDEPTSGTQYEDIVL
jgi:hypothetical protein